jgi:hypothetical protein
MNDTQRRPAFLAFCYGLLHWTLERMAPSWETEKAKRRERRSNLFGWRHDFMRFLARVALHLDADEVQRRVLDRIFPLEDELAESLINPFVDLVTTLGILDAPSIVPQAIALGSSRSSPSPRSGTDPAASATRHRSFRATSEA